MNSQVLKYFAVSILLASLSGCGKSDRKNPETDHSSRFPFLTGNLLQEKTLVLTYDDGPDEHTMEIARFLSELGIPATFFINGNRFCKNLEPVSNKCLDSVTPSPCHNDHPDPSPIYYAESILGEIIVLGHTIANHTHNHCNLAEESLTVVNAEIKMTQDIINRHVSSGPLFFRAPYGSWNARVDLAEELDTLIGPVGWDVDGIDWDCWHAELSVNACAERYLESLALRPLKSGIVLMHDRAEFNVGYDGTLQLTKLLVSQLLAEGYIFTKLENILP
jgi:peptidoglycan/xylan/chitin deacetylase (PgdA/CDA1 family)